MPAFDFETMHSVRLAAPARRAFDALIGLDLAASRLTSVLFAMRGFPASARSLDGLLRLGFVELARAPGRELVLGVVGRLWTPSGSLRKVPPGAFAAFARPGYTKAAWNFTATNTAGDHCELTTRTRVQSYGAWARFVFGCYWFIIRPFSGLIRREMLKAVKTMAESTGPLQTG